MTYRNVSRKVGWARPWGEGRQLANQKYAVHEGQAYRLYTTEAWFDEHANKFMGEGTPVPAAEW